MKYLFVLFAMTFSFVSHGQSIIGQWETFDDETKEKKQLLKFTKQTISFLLK